MKPVDIILPVVCAFVVVGFAKLFLEAACVPQSPPQAVEAQEGSDVDLSLERRVRALEEARTAVETSPDRTGVDEKTQTADAPSTAWVAPPGSPWTCFPDWGELPWYLLPGEKAFRQVFPDLELTDERRPLWVSHQGLTALETFILAHDRSDGVFLLPPDGASGQLDSVRPWIAATLPDGFDELVHAYDTERFDAAVPLQDGPAAQAVKRLIQAKKDELQEAIRQ